MADLMRQLEAFDRRRGGHHVTPWKKDKRLWLTAGTITAVLGLVAFQRPPDTAVLGFLGTVLTAFLAQSQWGQTKRVISEQADADKGA
jgi:hypothetical protein